VIWRVRVRCVCLNEWYLNLRYSIFSIFFFFQLLSALCVRVTARVVHLLATVSVSDSVSVREKIYCGAEQSRAEQSRAE